MTRTEELRIEWEKRIQEFKASGLSATAWCKAHDLKPHQLNYWLYKDKPTKPTYTPCNLIAFCPITRRREQANTLAASYLDS